MTKEPKVVATIEARMTSSRLPGKVLMPVAGKPLLQILVERLREARGVDEIIIATTINATDNDIETLGKRLGIRVFRGSELDVLGRVCGALRMAEADLCVEITGDCPLIDPDIVTEVVAEFQSTASTHKYVSNSDPCRSVPVGLDVQAFAAESLYELDRGATSPEDREHVSYAFYRPESGNKWNPRFLTHASTVGGDDVWVTLDYIEDYELIRNLHEELSQTKPNYRARDIIEWYRAHPDIATKAASRRKNDL
ncbi:MAG: glycosyltransferase family protein [Verrucomicrobiota bacterium]|nr:glycosyltransferase family protein [Verrucomicrobiota bacterium]